MARQDRGGQQGEGDGEQKGEEEVKKEWQLDMDLRLISILPHFPSPLLTCTH